MLSTALITAGLMWVTAWFWAADTPGSEFVIELAEARWAPVWTGRFLWLMLAGCAVLSLHYLVSRNVRWTTSVALTACMSGAFVGMVAAAAFRYSRFGVLQLLAPPTQFADRWLGGGYARVPGEWIGWPELHRWHLETYAPVYAVCLLLILLPLTFLRRRAGLNGSSPEA